MAGARLTTKKRLMVVPVLLLALILASVLAVPITVFPGGQNTASAVTTIYAVSYTHLTLPTN